MDSVSQFFSADHDRLDGLLAEYRRLKATDHAAAKRAFKEFLQGLKRHIVWEEDILFPAFEEGGPGEGGPTAVMRSEHRQIKTRLEAVHDKVREADPDSDDAVASLVELLGAHNMKEERILYPAIDEKIGAEGAAEAKKAMDAIPAERYAQCCGGH